MYGTGGGHWTVSTFGLGARPSYVAGAVGGLAFIDGRSQRLVDEATGMVLDPGGRGRGWNGFMGEWALGVRTRRTDRFDYTLAIRRRDYRTILEGTDEGATFQVRLGVLTR